MGLDSFFLTASFATPGLRGKLESLRADMVVLQEEYTAEYIAFRAAQNDLNSMEQKSEFVQREVEKTLAILSPPPEGEMEKVYDVLESYVHEPLNMVSTSMMAAGSLMFLVGYAATPSGAAGRATTGTKIKPGDKLGRVKAKPGLKPGAKLGKTVKAMSRGRSASRAAGKLTKASKWTKVAKVGSKLGTLGLVIGLVDIGIGMIDAKKQNDEFKAQAREIEKTIKQAEGEIKDLKSQAKEGRALVTRLLKDSGAETVDEFIKDLNEAIADLGRKSANIRTARRMMLDGLGAAQILVYVPELAAEVLSDLDRKLEAERRLLAGDDVSAVAEATELPQAKAALIAQLQTARAHLLAGDTIEEASLASGAPEILVEGEDETLLGDLRARWRQIDKRADANTLAAQLLTPTSSIEGLFAQLDAKRSLANGAPAEGIDERNAEAWSEDLEIARSEISALAVSGVMKLTDTELAADYLLPTSVVEEIRAKAAA